MSNGTILDLKQFKNKKELEKFTIVLFQECIKLRQKLEDADDKIKHLEELLEQALLSWDDSVK